MWLGLSLSTSSLGGPLLFHPFLRIVLAGLPTLAPFESHRTELACIGRRRKTSLRIEQRSRFARVVALAQDQIIEAVEGTNSQHFVLGVHWQALFKKFVEEARKYSRSI